MPPVQGIQLLMLCFIALVTSHQKLARPQAESYSNQRLVKRWCRTSANGFDEIVVD